MKTFVLDSGNILALLQKEIDWYSEHPNWLNDKSLEVGFIKGIEQAMFIIRHAEREAQVILCQYPEAQFRNE